MGRHHSKGTKGAQVLHDDWKLFHNDAQLFHKGWCNSLPSAKFL